MTGIQELNALKIEVVIYIYIYIELEATKLSPSLIKEIAITI